jgi:hypothetical protein
MPAPSTQLTSLRPDISGSVEEFDLAANRNGFVGPLILPSFPVSLVSSTFGVIPVAQLLKHPEVDRNLRGGFNRGEWKFAEDSYLTKEFGWEERVDNQEAKIYANYFDAEMVSAQICLDVVLRAAEQRIINKVTDSAVFTGSKTSAAATEWNDPASTPVDDVKAAREAIWALCGLWADTLTISEHTFQDLQANEQIKELITANGAGAAAKASDITRQMLAQCFNLSEVIVSGGTLNSANQGQTAAFGSMWPRTKALLFRKSRSGNIKEPGLGRTFNWKELGPDMPVYESYDEPQSDSRILRYRHRVDEKLIMSECGHVITGVYVAPE